MGKCRTTGPATRGLRALVTRPRAEAAELAAALAARGIEAIVEPMLDIHYRSAPAPCLEGVQAILCTSANGVRAFAQVSSERGLLLLAVGDATATRAREAGFARVASAGGTADDLARLARELLSPTAGRLLHVAGSEVAGDLAGMLRASGFTVARSVLYEADPIAGLSVATAQGLREGSVDFALFFSPRTAAIFRDLAERAGLADALASVIALSISAAADAALATLGFRERHVAARPDQPSLLAALDRLIAERRRA